MVETLPKFPFSQFFDVESFRLILHTPSTPYASVLSNELLWFDDGSKIYLQLCECLFFQFLQADPYVTLFANFYNPKVCLDVDDFEVPTSIDGSSDWSLCSHSNATVTNFNAPPTFDC